MVKRAILYSLLLLFAMSCITQKQQDKRFAQRSNIVEHIVRDSVFLHDSVSLQRRADTVFMERVRTLYRDRVSIDTFLMRDTIYSERVVKVKEEASYNGAFWLCLLFLLFLFLLMGLPQKLWSYLIKHK